MKYLSELPFPTSIFGYVPTKTGMEQFGDSCDDIQECLSYRLFCPCGNDLFEIFAIGCRSEYLTPPIFTACSACGKINLLFDPTQHGYDAEAKFFDSKQLGKDIPITSENLSELAESNHHWECSNCHCAGRLVVTLEYAIEDEFWDDFPEEENLQKENWFTWITVSHKCLNCDTVQHAFNYECA